LRGLKRLARRLFGLRHDSLQLRNPLAASFLAAAGVSAAICRQSSSALSNICFRIGAYCSDKGPLA